MKALVVIVALATTAFALPATAQLNMSSVYIGGDLGLAERKDSCGSILAGGSCDEKDRSWALFGGYQLNRNFAAELGYHDLGEIKASVGSATAASKTHVWDLVAVGMLPVMNTLSLYGKLGGYWAKSHLSSNVANGGTDTNTGLTYGAGVQWDAMPNIGVRAQWQRYDNVGGNQTGEGDINVVSVGALYRFR